MEAQRENTRDQAPITDDLSTCQYCPKRDGIEVQTSNNAPHDVPNDLL